MRGRLSLHGDWISFVLLLAPFLLGAYLLDNFHTGILTFHGTDELDYHFPVILRFAHQWPMPLLNDYASATTPLFHLILSLIGRAVGFELYRLRAANALFSFGAVWCSYRIWRDQWKLNQRSSLLLSTLLLSSPYFFGASFILLTDNLAWLFCLLAVYLFMEARRTHRWLPWVGACLCLSLALLTRQTFVWLAAAAGVIALRDSVSWTERVVLTGSVALAVLSLIPFIVMWHGLVPPSFQTRHEAHALINLRGLQYGLAVLGLYAVLLKPRAVLEMATQERTVSVLMILAVIGLLTFVPVGRTSGDDGILWRLSRATPNLDGSALLMWCLTPLGLAAAVHFWRLHRWTLPSLCLVFFLLSVLPSRLVYQKYFDPCLPLLLLMMRKEGENLSRWEQLMALGLIAGFALYALGPYLSAGAAAVT